MATITYIAERTQNKTAMNKVMNYCVRSDKTALNVDGKQIQLISGKDCTAETAFKEFMATKKQYGKDNGIFFYQYVQSFSPEEKITPQTAHEIGCKFAQYFKGHEVLISTHTDAKHIHTHFIINSVNFDNSKKLQMSRGSIYKLRQFSDKICREYRLSIIVPKVEKNSIKTREYRAALKGESWKFKLMNCIDQAMSISKNKQEFITQMQAMGYQVKWQDNLKHITYTTPNGMKCRDNKLHDEKYLKERMNAFYGYGKTESFKPTRKPDRELSDQCSILRDTTQNTGTSIRLSDCNSQSADSPPRTDQEFTQVGRNIRQTGSGTEQSQQPPNLRVSKQHESSTNGITKSDKQTELVDRYNSREQTSNTRTETKSTRLFSVENTPKMGRNRSSISNATMGSTLDIEDLLGQTEKQEREKDIVKSESHNEPKKKRPISRSR